MTVFSPSPYIPMTRFPGGTSDAVQVLTGATDAVKLYAGTVLLTRNGVDAATLALPIAGTADGQPSGQDGMEITFIDTGGHAHTVTTPSTPVLGIVPSHHIATFNGTAGSYCRLLAYNGLWYPVGSSGVTFS
jgi:hypothetical protein